MAESNNSSKRSRLPLFVGIAVAVVAVLAGALFYASPYITLYRMGQAVDEGDADYVCERIEFEPIQESVQAELDYLFEGQGVVGELMRLGGGEMSRRAVNCERVENAISLVGFFERRGENEWLEEFAEELDHGFESPSRFVIAIDDLEQLEVALSRLDLVPGLEPGEHVHKWEEIRLVMTREGVQWYLTDIEFDRAGS